MFQTNEQQVIDGCISVLIAQMAQPLPDYFFYFLVHKNAAKWITNKAAARSVSPTKYLRQNRSANDFYVHDVAKIQISHTAVRTL